MNDYTLTEVTVDAQDLLFDPRNPRIIEDPSKYICSSNADYSENWIQNDTLKALHQDKFNVNRLKRSIKTSGFLNIDSIFVKRYGASKYLVLEGNRRTAAIKSLLQEADLPEKTKRSIQEIPVKVLDVKNGAHEDEIITNLLSIRHLDGPLEWEPMQRAFVVYQTYIQTLEIHYNEDDFTYLGKAVAQVSEVTNIDKKNVYRNLCVVRVFQHLKELDLGVTSSHYSIIDKAVSYPKLSQGYFEFDTKKLQFSDSGAGKFANLCLEESRPINDPKKVRKLYQYFVADRPDLIEQLESRTISLDDADQLLEESKDSTRFITSLRAVNREIDKIRPTEFTGSAEEILLLKTIQDKINKKLAYVCRL